MHLTKNENTAINILAYVVLPMEVLSLKDGETRNPQTTLRKLTPFVTVLRRFRDAALSWSQRWNPGPEERKAEQRKCELPTSFRASHQEEEVQG